MHDSLVLLKRSLMKSQLLVKRGLYCEDCGKRFSEDLHEIVNRGRTVNNDEAREASYVPELTVLLCSVCHGKAHTPQQQDKYLRLKIAEYGREAVEQKFNALKAHMKTHIGMELPTDAA